MVVMLYHISCKLLETYGMEAWGRLRPSDGISVVTAGTQRALPLCPSESHVRLYKL